MSPSADFSVWRGCVSKNEHLISVIISHSGVASHLMQHINLLLHFSNTCNIIFPVIIITLLIMSENPHTNFYFYCYQVIFMKIKAYLEHRKNRIPRIKSLKPLFSLSNSFSLYLENSPFLSLQNNPVFVMLQNPMCLHMSAHLACGHIQSY